MSDESEKPELKRDSAYTAWANIKQRCLNPNHPAYPDYGGRGITVCERWLNSSEAFIKDMGPKPAPEYTVERDDVNGNYEPDNCRLATRAEQNRNRCDNRILECFGEKKCLVDWPKDPRCKVSKGTLASRMKYGWTAERAITTPVLIKRKPRIKVCPEQPSFATHQHGDTELSSKEHDGPSPSVSTQDPLQFQEDGLQTCAATSAV